MKKTTEKKKRISILVQVAILFVIASILVGSLLSWRLHAFSSDLVMTQYTDRAVEAAAEVKAYIDRFPAKDWLLNYWCDHYDELEIDYDAPYSADTVTARQYRLLMERHPSFSPEYADAEDAEALPEEDQKLYAEITYSWLISYIDQLEQSHELSYVFGVVTEDPYDRQVLLFISAKPGALRGSEKGQVYPIGTELEVTEERREAVRNAVAGTPRPSHNEDNKYVDYYYSVGSYDGREVLIGITINISWIEEMINDRTAALVTLSTIFLALLAVVCLLMILIVVLKPLKTVQNNISLFKNTKDSRTVADNLSKIRSHNEIEELADDVTEMAEEITAYMIRNEEIAVKEEHSKTELSLASRIQAAMLPNEFPLYPDRKGFDIYASMTPAREVGGDFYDLFLADDHSLCLVIADVSGKGVPAALYMMATKITLSHLIKSGKSPAQILTDANTSVCKRNPEEMFITVWLGILDLDTGTMVCANAGHEYPMLRKPGGNFEIIKDKHGFVLGGMEGIVYREYELQMEPGSSLFLYTDGLTEAVDPDGRMFGTARILEELNKEPGREPVKLLCDMKEAVNEYVAGMEPFDDLTMVGFTYFGPEA